MRTGNPHVPEKHTRRQKRFKLPESPWTYGDGLNPGLLPSNTARLRATATRLRENPVEQVEQLSPAYISGVPPYHSSFQDGGTNSEDSGSTSNEASSGREFGPDVDPPDNSSQVSVRLGSEGWEARPATRDQIDAGWNVGAWRKGIVPPPEPERYVRYVPHQDTTSEEEGEDEEDEDEDVWQPVAKRAKI